jgi:glutamate synthase (NADPH/NADH) small chain
MGKPTGFMEYDRKDNLSASPIERIKNFKEFHLQNDVDERIRQSARCMNCGIPFCQSGVSYGGMVSGCPLHNLIPEWNDEVYNGKFRHAVSRLKKTNNFPEFTGRVCPALCEAACTCSMYDDAVTIKENELFIIENAYKNHYIKPEPPETRTDKHIAVIGSGPSGLAVADQLNKRGHHVTVFEREDKPGGLLMYGIPNMKLEKQIIGRRIDIMKAEGVEFKTNSNVGTDIAADDIVNNFDAVILCCGAKNPRDIKAEGRDAQGIFFAVDFLSQVTKSLLNGDKNCPCAKGKDVVIIGGGDTGNDCVGTCIRQGAKSVTQLEMMPKLPDTRTAENPWPQWPRVCKTDYGQQEAIAVFGHDPRIYTTTVKEFLKDEKGNLKAVKTVKLNGRDEIAGSENIIDAQLVLIAAGFLGCQTYVSDAFGIELTPRTNVKTAENSFKTNVEKVFTAGDMHTGQSLVVWAIAQGRACAKEVDEFLMGYSNMIL